MIGSLNLRQVHLLTFYTDGCNRHLIPEDGPPLFECVGREIGDADEAFADAIFNVVANMLPTETDGRILLVIA